MNATTDLIACLCRRRTLIYTGRPLRVFKTPYVLDWEENRQKEIKELTGKGVIPAEHDVAEHPEIGAKARTCEFLQFLVSFLR